MIILIIVNINIRIKTQLTRPDTQMDVYNNQPWYKHVLGTDRPALDHNNAGMTPTESIIWATSTTVQPTYYLPT